MGGPVEKPCVDCGVNFPDTDVYFKRKKDGKLDIRCLQCRREKLRGKRQKERSGSLQDIERGAVRSFMGVASTGGQNIPHSCELLERLMEYFGGVSGFSALLVKQYFDSPPGGSARTKMLEALMRLVTKNTEAGGAKKPLGQWSDDELETELDARLRALAAQFQGRIIDGTLATEATQSTATPAIGLEGGGVPVRAAQGNPGRARRPANRGPKALRANPKAGGDARLPGK